MKLYQLRVIVEGGTGLSIHGAEEIIKEGYDAIVRAMNSVVSDEAVSIVGVQDDARRADAMLTVNSGSVIAVYMWEE